MMTIFRYSIVKCDIVKYMPKLIFQFNSKFNFQFNSKFSVSLLKITLKISKRLETVKLFRYGKI